MMGVTAPIYEDLLTRRQNILIAGMTGSGKSVILNGIINSILYENAGEHQLALIDMKVVEFSRYKGTAHCMSCATTPREAEATLNHIYQLIKGRQQIMKQEGLRDYSKSIGPIIHLFVDEMAELMLEGKKTANLLQRICQVGRAAGVQVICATQCPLASVIPTRIKVNFPIIIGLHTATAQHSRNILETPGCECLPMYGEALIMYPSTGIERKKIPMIPDNYIDRAINANRVI